MRDAFGGIANMAIIIIFLVLVSGYLAFNVNYTKAFRVKNKIISVFEQYEGNCKDATLLDNTCNGEIQKYMKSVGYSAPDFNMGGEKGWTCNYGYCYKGVRIKGTSDTKKKAYFKIVTQINIDIPIIKKIMPGLKIFQVSGDTKAIVVSETMWYDLCESETAC